MGPMGAMAGFLTAAVVLAGCQGAPKVPYERSAGAPKRIGIVTPSFPERPSVVLASSIGKSFGLIGR